jgi:hypothetical protein
MSKGIVTKLVTSFGSEWGRIRIAGAGTDLFFNRKSLLRPAEFDSLSLGQEVKFDEAPDPVNGSRAARMTMIKAARPAADKGRAS